MAEYGAGDDVELEPELDAFVRERLGFSLEDPETPDEDEVEEETDDEEEADSGATGEDSDESGTPPPPAPSLQDDDLIEVEPGITLTRAQAKSYKQFEAILNGDPELYAFLDERINKLPAAAAGQPSVPAPAAAAPTLPELGEEYLDDPVIKGLYDAAKQQQEYAAAQDARIRALTDVTVTRENEEIQHLVQTTKQAFATERSLTQEEIDKVEAVALRLQVLPALLTGQDPITGQVVPRDRGQALTRAYDIAYNWLPEFRERAIEAAVVARAKSTKRKQKLAGISGSSGSVPKGAPIRNATDRRNAMIAEVAGLMGQDSNDQE